MCMTPFQRTGLLEVGNRARERKGQAKEGGGERRKADRRGEEGGAAAAAAFAAVGDVTSDGRACAGDSADGDGAPHADAGASEDMMAAAEGVRARQ